MAYDCHDLEDGIGAGLIDENDLRGVSLWDEAIRELRRRYPRLPFAAIRRPVLDRLESAMLQDVVAESRRRIREAQVRTLDDVRRAGRPLVDFSPAMAARVAELEGFLRDRLYRHPHLVRMDDKAKRFVQQLFQAYLAEPRLLPPRFAERIGSQSAHRVICDYIAGMTDSFAQAEYKRLFEPFEKV